MTHHFDINDAKVYGVNAAIIFQNIIFWVAQNKYNKTNFHEGRTWTYNSVSAMADLFPYLTQKQIRTAIEVLKENNVILTGNFSQNRGDRSTWYALVEEEKHLTSRANGLPRRAKASALQGKSSINTDIKPDDVGASATDIILEKKKTFQETIKPFVQEFGRDTCNAFYTYWSEVSRNGKKLKWEMEDTWETRLRLVRWKKNEDSRKPNKNEETAPVFRKEGTDNQHILDAIHGPIK